MNTNIYKYLATHCFARLLVKTLFSQEIFVTSVGDLKLNYKCRQQFLKLLFLGYFAQYKLILN